MRGGEQTPPENSRLLGVTHTCPKTHTRQKQKARRARESERKRQSKRQTVTDCITANVAGKASEPCLSGVLAPGLFAQWRLFISCKSWILEHVGQLISFLCKTTMRSVGRRHKPSLLPLNLPPATEDYKFEFCLKQSLAREATPNTFLPSSMLFIISGVLRPMPPVQKQPQSLR